MIDETTLAQMNGEYVMPADYVTDAGEIDLWLLKDGLAKTPWERMQANDDAVNFGDTLRAAMKKRHAKPK